LSWLGIAVDSVRRAFRVTLGGASPVLLIALIVMIHAWPVLAAAVLLIGGVGGLEEYDRRAARRLQRRDEDDPEDLVRRARPSAPLRRPLFLIHARGRPGPEDFERVAGLLLVVQLDSAVDRRSRP
jgi:hypothetical protein